MLQRWFIRPQESHWRFSKTVPSDCSLTVAASSCFSSQKMCHILIVLSLKSVELPDRPEHPPGQGPRIPLHTCFNAVWFYCHFLRWKVINPHPSLPFTFAPGLCVILSASLVSGAWAPPGWQALIYPRRDGVLLCSPRSFTSHHKPPSFSFLSVIFSQRLCRALLWWGTCRLFKAGLHILSATREGHYPLQYWVFLQGKKTHWHTTYSMFDTWLIFQLLV